MKTKTIDWKKTDFVTIVAVAGWVAFCIILIMALIYLRFYH